MCRPLLTQEASSEGRVMCALAGLSRFFRTCQWIFGATLQPPVGPAFAE